MLTTVAKPEVRPLGWNPGLESFGIPYRWVCIESPIGLGKSKLVDLVRVELVNYLEAACASLAGSAGARDVAEEMIESVRHVRQPGAMVELPDGSSADMRKLASADIPAEASFALYIADRVIQNRHVLELLDSCSLVVQERGAFSTYVYQCVLGGISPSVFAKVTEALTPARPDLMVLLSPGRPHSEDAKAYSNPPASILRLCAKNFALIGTDGLDPKMIAAAIVDAMSGRRLVLPVSG